MDEIKRHSREQANLLRYVGRWLALVTPLAFLAGVASALFSWLLDLATQTRLDNPSLLWLLPFGGIFIAALYRWAGRGTDAGNNLLMESITAHEQDDSSVVVPGRMAPLILVATVITHLFGGSVGREGTAVQMGGAIAARLGRWFRLGTADQRILLMAGISAGFGGIFGTPITGAIFAMEVLAIGSIRYDAILPCLLAGLLSNWTALALGTSHAVVVLPSGMAGGILPDQLFLSAKVALAAVFFGLASAMFAALTHWLGGQFQHRVANPFLRPAMGGIALIAFTLLLGTTDHLGLGTGQIQPGRVNIASAFIQDGAKPSSWFIKTLATALSLGSGFKGGEVTPLFYIGATLGNQLAGVLAAPVPLFAALGFVAVFGAATNTPLAGTLLGIELFGAEYAAMFAIANFVAYLFSGHKGIYLGQRIAIPKPGRHNEPKGFSDQQKQ